MDLLTSAAEAVSNEGVRVAVLMAAFVTGLRHGFDLDEVIAITDITSAHTDRKRSFTSASACAVGHGLVLLALGLVAVLVGARLPASVDSLMSRVVGFTLIVLGAYVFYSLPRLRRGVRPRSRATLVLGASQRVIDLIRRRKPLRHLEIEHEREHHSEGHGHHHEEHRHEVRVPLRSQSQRRRIRTPIGTYCPSRRIRSPNTVSSAHSLLA